MTPRQSHKEYCPISTVLLFKNTHEGCGLIRSTCFFCFILFFLFTQPVSLREVAQPENKTHIPYMRGNTAESEGRSRDYSWKIKNSCPRKEKKNSGVALLRINLQLSHDTTYCAICRNRVKSTGAKCNKHRFPLSVLLLVYPICKPSALTIGERRGTVLNCVVGVST